VIDIRQGEYRIIRTDGRKILVEQKPTIRGIHRDIGCECCDSVTLQFGDYGHIPTIVMVVDDTGMLDGKPVNDKATALVREARGQDYPYFIHGDVAVVNDEDFA
jgi:hypothetical protein